MLRDNCYKSLQFANKQPIKGRMHSKPSSLAIARAVDTAAHPMRCISQSKHVHGMQVLIALEGAVEERETAQAHLARGKLSWAAEGLSASSGML